MPEGRTHGVPSGMPAAALKPVLDGVVAEGGSQTPSSTAQGRERLPLPSLRAPRELLRSFPHSKRVGSYLVGKMINRGSFAKVMEGLHISTGEKVSTGGRTEMRQRLVLEDDGCRVRRGSGLETSVHLQNTHSCFYVVSSFFSLWMQHLSCLDLGAGCVCSHICSFPSSLTESSTLTWLPW